MRASVSLAWSKRALRSIEAPSQELIQIVSCRIRLSPHMLIRIKQSSGDKTTHWFTWKLAKAASQMPQAEQCVTANERIGSSSSNERYLKGRC